jgi:hypothetical protein
MKNYKETKLAKLEEEFSKKRQQIEAEASIYEHLPEGCPDPSSIYSERLYGIAAGIKFGDFRQSVVNDLPLLIELLPALNLYKTAAESEYVYFLPEACHQDYPYRVKCWTPVGRYIFKVDRFDVVLLWYTELGRDIVEVTVSLSEIRGYFVTYREPSLRDGEWERRFSERWNMHTDQIDWYSSERGANPRTIYSYTDISPFEMFDFAGLIEEKAESYDH